MADGHCVLTYGHERVPIVQKFSHSLRMDTPTAAGPCAAADVAAVYWPLWTPSYSQARGTREDVHRCACVRAAEADRRDQNVVRSRRTDTATIHCRRCAFVHVTSSSTWMQTTYHSRDTNNCHTCQPNFKHHTCQPNFKHNRLS